MTAGTCTDRPDPARRAARDNVRRRAKRRLLRSVRETLAEAQPVLDGIAGSPADESVLDRTRARIAAALSEADRIEWAMDKRRGGGTCGDPAALAKRMSLDRLGWVEPDKGE